MDDYVVLGGIEGLSNQYRVCTRHCVLYEGYRLLRVEPDNIDARHLLARGWLAAGNKDLAAEHLSSLLEQEKGTLRVTELQIQLHQARREYGSLERTLEAAAKAGLFDAQRTAESFYQAATMACEDQSHRQASKQKSITWTDFASDQGPPGDLREPHRLSWQRSDSISQSISQQRASLFRSA